MKSRSNRIVAGIIVLALAGVIYMVATKERAPSKLDGFAACIQESGATFYGAFWCPHCQNQKAMFGRSAKLLPYAECSTPDGRGQLTGCKDLAITTYPTWVFGDGSTTTGEIPLKILAEKTSCALPLEE